MVDPVEYPAWICSDCGQKYGTPRGQFATYHIGDRCGWCDRDTAPVTEPRDYGYPKGPKG